MTTSNKTIILGVTASIAAYKSAEIARQFCKEGYEVYPILTQKATEFIGSLTLEALTGKQVPAANNKSASEYFSYLKLAKNIDLMLIVPATANIIANIAYGFASDLLETLVLARDCPLIIAPAMNERMWLNSITQENVNKLKKLGVEFIGPAKGDLACGDEGIGRLADVKDIMKACQKKF